jgi:CubicO group peptidase (beta-lactamase class C family)
MSRRCNLLAAAGFDLEPWIARDDGPGAVAAVLSRGQVQSWAGRGRETIDADAPPLTPETVFYAASISKQFTAACVALCEASGLLDVTASVRIYLPELPALFEPITLKHLLHHLSGLPRGRDLLAAPVVAGDWWDGQGLWDLIAVLANETDLASPPGDRYLYSNAGYWLLAATVERVSGRSFAAFASEHLLAPLGMTHSRFRDDPDAPQPGLVVGHAFADGRFMPIHTRFHGVGDGGLLTSLKDLAGWDMFWSGRSPLDAALPVRLTDRGRRNDGAWLYYAWGVSLRTHRGTISQSHGGSYIGYLSKLVRFPEYDFSLACLANADNVDVDGLALALADEVLEGAADMTALSWAASVRDDALAI